MNKGFLLMQKGFLSVSNLLSLVTISWMSRSTYRMRNRHFPPLKWTCVRRHQACSFRETGLGWLSYADAPLDRSWRAGWQPPEQTERARSGLPPQLPRGKSAFLEKLSPRKTRPAKILASGGSLRKKPTRHDHSTAQLSRWAVLPRQTALNLLLTDLEHRAKEHQTVGNSSDTKETSQN